MNCKRFLELLMVCFVVVGFAQAAPLDTTYIPDQAVAAVIVHPRDMLSAPTMDLLPLEVFTAVGMEQLGVDPLDVEELVLVSNRFQGPLVPPDIGAVVRLSKPYQQQSVVEKILPDSQAVEEDGVAYHRQQLAPLNLPVALHWVDDQTFLVGAETMLKQMLKAQSPTGKLATLLTRTSTDHHIMAVVSVDAMREDVNQMLQGLGPAPPPFNQFLAAPDLISSVAMRFNAGAMFKFDLLVLGHDETAAEELNRLSITALDLGKQAFVSSLRQQQLADDEAGAVEKAMIAYAQRMADHYVKLLTPRRNGRLVILSTETPSTTNTMGVYIAMLLPAVNEARRAAERMNSINNLKQIGLAMHNYHDTYRKFPAAAAKDDQGQPLLSWRVHLLPFLGESALYEQFRQDEPWDSEHNRKLVAKMPDAYGNPKIDAGEGKTTYLAATGEGAIFGDGAQAVGFRDVTDGTSNTIMAVEVDAPQAVVWTKPEDYTFNKAAPREGLGEFAESPLLALFADGSVKQIPASVEDATLNALFTRAGGETVNTDF